MEAESKKKFSDRVKLTIHVSKHYNENNRFIKNFLNNNTFGKNKYKCNKYNALNWMEHMQKHNSLLNHD